MIDRLSSRSSQPLDPASADATEAAPDNAETESAGESSAQETPTFEQAAHDVIGWGEQYLRQWFPGPSLDSPSAADPNAGTPVGATGPGHVTPHTTDANEATAAITKPTGVEPNTVVYRSEKEARAALAAKAIANAGCGVQNQPDVYKTFLAGPELKPPADDDAIRQRHAQREAVLHMSSCALFARAVLRESGCNDPKYLSDLKKNHVVVNPKTGKEHKVENAVRDVIEAAEARDAWKSAPVIHKKTEDLTDVSKLPKQGDVVMIVDSAENGSEHVMVFTSDPVPDHNRPGDFLVTTAEGGQGNYKEGTDYCDTFGTPPGIARNRAEDNPPKRLRVGPDGHLYTVKKNGEMSKRHVFGYADAGKMMGPYHA